jgi:hypothetical protein
MFADLAEMVLIFYNCQLLIGYCYARQSFLLEFEEIILIQNTHITFLILQRLDKTRSIVLQI